MYDSVLKYFSYSLLEHNSINNKLREREAKKETKRGGTRSKKYHEYTKFQCCTLAM